MPERKKYHIPGLLKVSVAIVLTGAILVLSVSAVGNKDEARVNNININIQKIDGVAYISENEIASVLKKSAGKELKHQPIGSLDLAYLEKELMGLRWVKRAELFIDNRNVLQINIEQHKPVARVFTRAANSFFISDNSTILPYRSSVKERMPLFTGFTGNTAHLNHGDSLLIGDIVNIAGFLKDDNFWMAQIDQIDITSGGAFEMVPKLGNQIIRFGDGTDYKIKFSKLLAFYKQVLNRTGWERYAVIDLRYKDQVVAERRDAARVREDSLAALRIMKSIIENAQKTELSDSIRIQLPDKPNNEKIRTFSSGRQTPQEEVVSEVIPAPDTQQDSLNGGVKSLDNGLENDSRENTGTGSQRSEQKEKNQSNTPKAIMPPKNGN